MKGYDDTRAPKHDDWYRGNGLFAGRERPGWDAEVEQLRDVIAGLPRAHPRGDVVGLDDGDWFVAVRAEP